MAKQAFFLFITCLFFVTTGCTSKNKTEFWIYTSIYKDTVSEIKAELEKQFPEVTFNFYQAGSEEIATKVNTEDLAQNIQADLLISSDRFWYEDLANKGKLVSYKPKNYELVEDFFKHKDGLYTTVSFPLMVIGYNSEAVPDNEAPQTFKELALPKWKNKITSGSPLASGTQFTSVAFLKEKYGWDYFKDLRKNELMAEGGNSGVIRRLQSKEKPVGIILLENILRLKVTDPRIKAVFPKDGSIIQSNIMAIVKKQKTQTELAQKVADWFLSEAGQKNMIKSYMYSPLPDFAQPEGAPDFKTIKASAKPWTKEFLEKTMQDRDKIKDEYSKIIF